jgi:hypothetical protein
LLTENINLKKQVANGSEAIVCNVCRDFDSDISTIMVKNCSNSKTIKVARSRIKYRRIVGHLIYYKSIFPLILGYAMTAHKAQGTTA